MDVILSNLQGHSCVTSQLLECGPPSGVGDHVVRTRMLRPSQQRKVAVGKPSTRQGRGSQRIIFKTLPSRRQDDRPNKDCYGFTRSCSCPKVFGHPVKYYPSIPCWKRPLTEIDAGLGILSYFPFLFTKVSLSLSINVLSFLNLMCFSVHFSPRSHKL